MNFFKYTFNKRALCFWAIFLAVGALAVGRCWQINRPVMAFCIAILVATFFAAYCLMNFLKSYHFKKMNKYRK